MSDHSGDGDSGRDAFEKPLNRARVYLHASGDKPDDWFDAEGLDIGTCACGCILFGGGSLALG